ncbi:MAG: RHS repeat-associated core domain-containing protein, partial [Candidatus Methylacidiphilales bacterium]
MRTSETGFRGMVAFGYNNRYEVTGVTEPSGSPFADQEFTYDDAWNRASWTLGSTTTTYAVNNLNQYTTVSSHTAPTWNANGNLASFNGKAYTYDTFNRLTSVVMSTGSVELSYDPLGRRTKKVVKDTGGSVIATYQYHHDGQDIAVEYRPSSVTCTYFLGQGIDDIVMRTDGTHRQYYYKNGLGSVIAVADNSGDLLESYEYNVQGQVAMFNSVGSGISSSGIGNDHLYTGRQLDPETGDYYYRARYYSPILGRFISRDPLSGAEFSQGSNLYAYVGNNPVNYIDPNGENSV